MKRFKFKRVGWYFEGKMEIVQARNQILYIHNQLQITGDSCRKEATRVN